MTTNISQIGKYGSNHNRDLVFLVLVAIYLRCPRGYAEDLNYLIMDFGYDMPDEDPDDFDNYDFD